MSDAENQLIDGNQQVTDGIQQLLPMIGQPAQELLTGNQQVKDGLQQLQENNNQLKAKIADDVSQVGNVSFESENEKALNDVTKVKENNPTNADQYGATIFPYMSTLNSRLIS